MTPAKYHDYLQMGAVAMVALALVKRWLFGADDDDGWSSGGGSGDWGSDCGSDGGCDGGGD